MPPQPVRIADAVLAAVYAHARSAFPAECCGWLAGPRAAHAATKARPCRNGRSSTGALAAFAIEGPDLIALALALDGPEPPKVVYHSHPDGSADLSLEDRRQAADPWGERPMLPVQHLVVAIRAARVVEARLFGWDAAARGFLEIARFAGTAHR